MFEVIFDHPDLCRYTVNVMADNFIEAYYKLSNVYETVSGYNSYGLDNIVSFKSIANDEVEYIK